MKKRFKLIVFDVDGTLSTGQHAIPNRVSQKLCDYEASGIKVCLASGKDHYYLTALSRGMGLKNVWIIAENGAVFQTNYGKQYLDSSPKIKSELSRFRDQIKIAFPNIWFQNNDISITVFFDSSLSSDSISKFVESHREDYEIEFSCFAHPDTFDIVPVGTDKSLALQRIKKEMRFSPFEIIVVGDGPNDEKMLFEAQHRLIVGDGLEWLTDVPRCTSPVEMLDVVDSIIGHLD